MKKKLLFLLLTLMPMGMVAQTVVTQTVVAASQYGADERLAARGAALSTLLSFLVIPVLMLLL